MTTADKAQTRSRLGTTMSELYELYLRVMRRVGHYRWFSLFMKHVGSRVDRALIRASRGRFSMSGPRCRRCCSRRKAEEAAKIEQCRCTTCATARTSSPLARTSG